MIHQRHVSLVLLRFFFYTLVVFTVTGALPWLLQSMGRRIFKENGPVECTQLALLIVAAIIFILVRLRNRFAHLSTVFVGVTGIAAVRELDALLDTLIPYVGWQLPAGLVLMSVGIMGWRERTRIVEQMAVFVHVKAFGLLWAGFIIAIPLGQLIGHGEFLMTLMQEAYERDYKRVIEESAEVIGYMVLVFGTVETYLESRLPGTCADASHQDVT